MKWIRSRRTGKRHWMTTDRARTFSYAFCNYWAMKCDLDLPGDEDSSHPDNCKNCLRIKRVREKR